MFGNNKASLENLVNCNVGSICVHGHETIPIQRVCFCLSRKATDGPFLVGATQAQNQMQSARAGASSQVISKDLGTKAEWA